MNRRTFIVDTLKQKQENFFANTHRKLRTSVCIHLFAWLLGLAIGTTTYRKFQMSAFKRYIDVNVYCSSAESGSERPLPDCSIGVKDLDLERSRLSLMR